jgi:hypothetical protein
LESNPELRDGLKACVHCGIEFLTHPRNARRQNLRCPFGCRRCFRKIASNQRSTAYYQTASGKLKKKRINERRTRGSSSDERQQPADPDAPPDGTSDETSDEPLPSSLWLKMELRLEEIVLDASSLATSPMLSYVQMLLGLIEGLRVGRNELINLLRRWMRQHSIAFRRRSDYVLGFLHQHPP